MAREQIQVDATIETQLITTLGLVDKVNRRSTAASNPVCVGIKARDWSRALKLISDSVGCAMVVDDPDAGTWSPTE